MPKLIFSILLSLVALFSNADTLTILHEIHYYPYAFVNEKGESDGILIDYWKLWAERNHQPIHFKPTQEDQMLSLLQSNPSFFIAGLSLNDSLNKIFDFTDPLMQISTTLYLRDSVKPKSIYDIRFTLYTLDDQHISHIITQKAPHLKVLQFTDFNSLSQAIRSDSSMGFIYDIPSPFLVNYSPKIPDGFYNYYNLSKDHIRAAVLKGNSNLRDRIILGTTKITSEDILHIAKKWGIDTEKPQSNSFPLYIIILVFVALSIMYLIYIQKQKKKQVPTTDILSSEAIRQLLVKGENDSVEFKSSLRWDYREQKLNKVLEQVIAKTISAFLNSEGGMLFIGVDDEGNALGLDNDISTLSKKSTDGFLLAMTNLINQSMGKNAHQFVKINIYSIDSKEICLVNIEPSSFPIFLKKANNEEEFFIRASASSQPLNIRETHEYIQSHWK